MSRWSLLCASLVMLWAGRARADDLPPLGAAVSKGDAAEVTRRLDGGDDPDMLVDGLTMLTWAAGTGKLPIVKILIAHHATVDPPVKNGFTPLAAASSNKHPDIVAYLIAQGAKVNTPMSSGWTPLDDAEAQDDAKSAKLLRDHGGTTGLPPLLEAVNRRDLAKVKKLLASGADPSAHDAENGTALAIAANRGSLAIVKELVARKADLDTASTSGWTPLMEAAMNGHLDVATYLVERGAKLDLRDGDGNTALAIAVQDQHADVAKLLRDHGATDAPTPAPAAAAPAPTPPTDDECAAYRRMADMGPSGYASMVAGPPDELTHEQPATERFGESTCTVSEDNRTFLCVWKDDAKDYDDIAWFVTQCSAGAKVDATTPGKTIVWYGGVPAKTLVKVYVSDDDLALKFFGSPPAN